MLITIYFHITKVITSLVELSGRQLLESSAVGRPAAEINALVIRRDAGTGESEREGATTLHLSIYLSILSYPIYIHIYLYIYISVYIYQS